MEPARQLVTAQWLHRQLLYQASDHMETCMISLS